MSDFQREDQLPSFGEFKIMDEFDPNKRFQAGSLGARVRGLRSAAIGTHGALSEAYCSMLAACIDSSTSGSATAVIGATGSSAGGSNTVIIASSGASNSVPNSLAGGVGGVKWHLFSAQGDLRLNRHAHIKNSLHIDDRLEVEGDSIFRGKVEMDGDLSVRNGAIDCTALVIRGPLPPVGSFNIPDELPNADFAEVFENATGVIPGNGLLLTLDNGKVRPADAGEAVMGITSDTAGILLGADSDSTDVPPTHTENTVVVGLLGQVYVRVSENLAPGTYVMPFQNGVGREAFQETDEGPRPIETNVMVMEMTSLYSEALGYGVAKCFLSGFFNQLYAGAGGGGTGDDKHFIHNQSIAAATWVVTHNLGKHPSVTVVTSAGEQVFGDVLFLNQNAVEISFSAAFSGRAYFN